VNAACDRSGVPCQKREAKRSAFERWFSEGAAFSARRISHAAFATGRIELAAGERTETAETDPAEAPLGFYPCRRIPAERFREAGAPRGFTGRNDRADDAGERGRRGAGISRRARKQRRATASGTREFERMYEETQGRQWISGRREPVRMVHHPNPYADAPSLYDLYVQASWPASARRRFGAEVFRRGR